MAQFDISSLIGLLDVVIILANSGEAAQSLPPSGRGQGQKLVATLAVRDLTSKKTIGWLIIIIFGLLAGIYGERALISLFSQDWYALIISAVVILISVRVIMLGGKLARES